MRRLAALSPADLPYRHADDGEGHDSLDVRLPDGTGVDACREIRSDHPDLPCRMLTAVEDETTEESSDETPVDDAETGTDGTTTERP